MDCLETKNSTVSNKKATKKQVETWNEIKYKLQITFCFLPAGFLHWCCLKKSGLSSPSLSRFVTLTTHSEWSRTQIMINTWTQCSFSWQIIKITRVVTAEVLEKVGVRCKWLQQEKIKRVVVSHAFTNDLTSKYYYCSQYRSKYLHIDMQTIERIYVRPQHYISASVCRLQTLESGLFVSLTK